MHTRLRRGPLTAMLLISASIQLASAGTVTMVTIPTLAPNESGALGVWVANATQAFIAGSAQYGTADTPGYFQGATPVVSSADIVTSQGFSVWKGAVGDAAITSQFGSAYAGQTGQTLSYMTMVDGGGDKISPNHFSFFAATAPVFDVGLTTYTYLELTQYGYYPFPNTYFLGTYGVGCDKNLDGSINASSCINSGPKTVGKDVLLFLQIGQGLEAVCTACSLGNQQGAVAAALAGFASSGVEMENFQANYVANISSQVVSQSATTQYQINAAPEPATGASLLLLGGFLLVLKRKGRSK